MSEGHGPAVDRAPHPVTLDGGDARGGDGGRGTDEIDGVEVVTRPALTASAVNVLSADGYLLGTPANIGYMSGALKHFFDGIYYPCLDATQRRHYGLYVHGNNDTGGAVRAVEAITTGLRWHAPAAGHGRGGRRARRPGGLLGTGRHRRRGAGLVILTAAGLVPRSSPSP